MSDYHNNENSELTMGLAIIATGMATIAQASFVPTPQCYWCTSNGFDVHMARALISPHLEGSRLASDIFTFGSIPILAFSPLLLSSPNLSHAF